MAGSRQKITRSDRRKIADENSAGVQDCLSHFFAVPGYQRKVFGCERVCDLYGLLFVLGQDEKGVLFQNFAQSSSARQGVHLRAISSCTVSSTR